MKNRALPEVSRALLKRIARLQQRKYRDREGLFIAEGLRTVRELLGQMAGADMLDCLICTAEGLAFFPESSIYSGSLFLASEDDFNRVAGTSSPQGVLGVFRQPVFPLPYERPYSGRALLVALDEVQDPGNAGTILRTAAWLGADGLLAGPGTVDLYNAKTVRSSAGSLLGMPHTRAGDLPAALRQLQKAGFKVICSSLEGEDFRSGGAWPERTVLVVGNEANGVGPEVRVLADRLVKIPHGRGPARVESLNAAVSAAILMERILL
ncbi:TrmH family RNA methyltransferase [Pelodictyon luteolum]|uniref:SpoU rRNA methylase family protein n=1 Tax=Chlorobium luteolum (strain DSM 273 / BCRC 81028 / 2530) TaxID=319225 RepID=Q3B647_CHLL3|nr:RNA methyltransferase [Pelodictyon luteolum]ABB23184.1 SpoU rRNA methylase family protein [Pelodictyon luteolum DSM 273]